MVQKKHATIIVPVLVGLVMLSAVLLLKTSAERDFAEGNAQVATGEYEEALVSYQSAGIMWPIMRMSPEYQKNVTTTKATIKQLLDNPVVTIIIKDNTANEDIESLTSEIKKVEGVREVKIISQEEALQTYKAQSNSDAATENLVTKEILPVIITVYTQKIPTSQFKENLVALASSKSFVQVALKNY